MKLRTLLIVLLCLLLSGCNAVSQPAQTTAAEPAQTAAAEPARTEASGNVIRPLEDTTMEAMDNATVHISFGQEDISQGEDGRIVLRMQVYSYEKFDMVDISGLKAGDTILVSGEEIAVTSVQRNDHGTVLVNGGLDEGGFDLATDDSGIYYVQGYSDMKSWYLVGQAQYPVAEGFVFADSADLEQGELTYTAGQLLDGAPAAAFGYQPQNTTVRVENGQVAAMYRIYTP